MYCANCGEFLLWMNDLICAECREELDRYEDEEDEDWFRNIYGDDDFQEIGGSST